MPSNMSITAQKLYVHDVIHDEATIVINIAVRKMEFLAKV